MTTIRWAGLFALLFGVGASGCDNEGGGTPARPNFVGSGIMQKGSIILNGVRFDDARARIVIDDQAQPAAELEEGMHVTIAGAIDDNGTDGVRSPASMGRRRRS